MLTGLGKNGLRAGIGPALEALAAPEGIYADVEALDPTVFLQLRYPVYNEQFVLFQDAACTTPVTIAGQHTIGGVKNPFTGAIIATQATAAARPMWGGPTVGAIFDGTNRLNVSTGGSSGTNPWAWTTVPRQSSKGSTQYVWQMLEGSVNAWVRSNNDGQSWNYVGVGDDANNITGGPASLVISDSLGTMIRNPITVRFEYSGTESTIAGQYADQAEVIDSLDPSTGLTVPSTLALGETFNGSNGLDGAITEAAFALGADASYVTSLHDALQGITVDVRQITDWADAGTGTVDGELLLWTNADNQDALLEWDAANSAWSMRSTFDEYFMLEDWSSGSVRSSLWTVTSRGDVLPSVTVNAANNRLEVNHTASASSSTERYILKPKIQFLDELDLQAEISLAGLTSTPSGVIGGLAQIYYVSSGSESILVLYQDSGSFEIKAFGYNTAGSIVMNSTLTGSADSSAYYSLQASSLVLDKLYIVGSAFKTSTGVAVGGNDISTPITGANPIPEVHSYSTVSAANDVYIGKIYVKK